MALKDRKISGGHILPVVIIQPDNNDYNFVNVAADGMAAARAGNNI